MNSVTNSVRKLKQRRESETETEANRKHGRIISNSHSFLGERGSNFYSWVQNWQNSVSFLVGVPPFVAEFKTSKTPIKSPIFFGGGGLAYFLEGGTGQGRFQLLLPSPKLSKSQSHNYGGRGGWVGLGIATFIPEPKSGFFLWGWEVDLIP